MQAHLRVARPTDNLEPLVALYRDGLDLEVLGSFTGHDGFDGVMLGRPELGYQLEFTHHRGHTVGRAPTQDNLLVFYVEEKDAWEKRCAKMVSAGFTAVKSFNASWDVPGRTLSN